mmetsp:Transcript_28293/g.83092  ORF Transcript_28293/g.83092 Transcript_28293/m.83092 type:complete len:423 (-) Transcript_28293:14-1282(-)
MRTVHDHHTSRPALRAGGDGARARSRHFWGRRRGRRGLNGWSELVLLVVVKAACARCGVRSGRARGSRRAVELGGRGLTPRCGLFGHKARVLADLQDDRRHLAHPRLGRRRGRVGRNRQHRVVRDRRGGRHPGMAQDLLGGDARVSIHCEEAADEVLDPRGRPVPPVWVEQVVARLDLLEELLVSLSVKGRVPRDDDVENHAEGPQVHARPVGHVLEHLGRDVARGAARGVHVASPVRVEDATEAEVDDRDVRVRALGPVDEVLGLEVAVHHAVGMHLGERGGHLAHELPRLHLGKRRLAHNLVKELTAFQEFEDKDKGDRGLVLIQQTHNIAVLAGLSQEVGFGLGLGGVKGSGARDKLDGDRLARPAHVAQAADARVTAPQHLVGDVILGPERARCAELFPTRRGAQRVRGSGHDGTRGT